MKRHVLVGVVSTIVVLACGGGPGTSEAPSAAPTVGVTQDPTLSPAGLCASFTEQLAVAALGEAVDPPTFGDVVPRPNGVYCHYAAAANPQSNVEAQLKEMTRDEFEALAETLGVNDPLAGVGEAAYMLNAGTVGGPGLTVLAWADGRGVTVVINDAETDLNTVGAAAGIAAAALSS
jgi:hypothetical protein